MSESASFTPRPRALKRPTPRFDVDNFLRELDVISRRIERVAAGLLAPIAQSMTRLAW